MIDTSTHTPIISCREFDLELIAILNGYCKTCNPNQISNQRCIHFNDEDDEDDENQENRHNSIRRRRRRRRRRQNCENN